jgi:hypothetical protein
MLYGHVAYYRLYWNTHSTQTRIYLQELAALACLSMRVSVNRILWFPIVLNRGVTTVFLCIVVTCRDMPGQAKARINLPPLPTYEGKGQGPL